MIAEHPLLGILTLETYDPDTAAWTAWTPDLNQTTIQRGGARNGPTTTVEPGILTARLVNAGDPLAGSTLRPNLPLRIRAGEEPIFTGRIHDLATTYELDKSSGELTTFVSISASDAVASLANTIRYGAVTDGGIGFETWAQRINRLALSAVTTVDPPGDDSPIVRYSL